MAEFNFRWEEMPEGTPLNKRECRAGCGNMKARSLLVCIERPEYAFPSCEVVECQEPVKNKILEAIARSKIPA